MLTFFPIRHLFNIETELESNEVFKALVATDLKRKGSRDYRSPFPISENDYKQLTMRKSCKKVRENLRYDK